MQWSQVESAVVEVEALERTVWASRVWTVQEAILSHRVVFVGKTQVKSALELAIASSLQLLSRAVIINAHAAWNTSPTGRNHIAVRTENYSGGVDDTPILRDSKLLAATEDAQTIYNYLDEVWRITGQRHSTYPEDRVYGMLGLLRDGHKLDIEPDIVFEEAVRRAADAGLVSSDILLAETSSLRTGLSWCPQPGTESRTRHTKRSKYDKITELRLIELTPDGLCKVQGARSQISSQTKTFLKWGRYTMTCKNLEGGRNFRLSLDIEVPEGEEWMGDWLAIVELEGPGRTPSRATLLKYETQAQGILRKLQTLEADIWFSGTQYVADYLLC